MTLKDELDWGVSHFGTERKSGHDIGTMRDNGTMRLVFRKPRLPAVTSFREEPADGSTSQSAINHHCMRFRH